MKKKKKDGKWLKFRHRVVRNIVYCVLRPYVHFKYGIKIEKFKEQEKRPYLILLNHQTPFDQFFVGMTFKGPVYYMATEDIFSLGWISSLIKYLVEPIPIKKQTTDVRAIISCLKVAKEGGTIAIAPEGNRTYSGRTEYMNPSIVSLARKLGMPILLYRIEGGYGSEPRWSDVVRKGKMRVWCARVLKPEEYAEMSDSELFSRSARLFTSTKPAPTANITAKRARNTSSARSITAPFAVCPSLKAAARSSNAKNVAERSATRHINSSAA